MSKKWIIINCCFSLCCIHLHFNWDAEMLTNAVSVECRMMISVLLIFFSSLKSRLSNQECVLYGLRECKKIIYQSSPPHNKFAWIRFNEWMRWMLLYSDCLFAAVLFLFDLLNFESVHCHLVSTANFNNLIFINTFHWQSGLNVQIKGELLFCFEYLKIDSFVFRPTDYYSIIIK